MKNESTELIGGVSLADEGRWGLCPICHRVDEFANHGEHHWQACSEHKSAWYIGSNLFSCWRDDPDGTDEKFNSRFLGYEVVQPWYPDRIDQEEK